ncbi:type II toxin-antitoxin system RelE/ParE family toxin [Roseateles sp. So40a]|uniref:type II toxin-antitoxin system RelE/ParE family toxin n=1 Tax=Roseateles sp. So40a TaxID=3400226 RepID=UPI003A87F6EE
MTVAFSQAARTDLSNILRRIHADKPLAALRMREEFFKKFSLLEFQPGIGTLGEDGETRELCVKGSYRIVYRNEGAVLWIVRVDHTARQRPGLESAGAE